MKPHTRSPIYVTVDLGTPEHCGTLWCEASRGKEIFSFEYEESWLAGVAKYFRLKPRQAQQRLSELQSAVRGRIVAKTLGLSRSEIDAMETAFRLAGR